MNQNNDLYLTINVNEAIQYKTATLNTKTLLPLE